MVCLDEVEHFAENQKASVASLRRCSPSARNGVQLPSGMLFSLAGIPTTAPISGRALDAEQRAGSVVATCQHLKRYPPAFPSGCVWCARLESSEFRGRPRPL